MSQMNEKLAALLTPQRPKFERYILRIDGQPKTSKTTLAVTASRLCPNPAQWDAKKPVELTDMLWMQFEPNALMYPASRGIIVPNVLDWSDQDLTIGDLQPAIKALPEIAKQYRDQGVTTIVVDTLSAFNRFLLREIIERPNYEKDMDRIRAYGRVDDMHYLLFDSLRATGLNIIGIVHLQAFQPFGESDDAKTAAQQAMNAQAEKQTSKVEAQSVAGMRTDFIADIRPKPAGHWARLSDAVLVAKPALVPVSAGKKAMKYQFVAQTDGEFSAGGRWDLPAVNDGYLRPHVEAKYPKK